MVSQYGQDRITPEEIATLADSTRQYFHDHTIFKDCHHGVLKITTPFLDVDNEYIVVYAIKNENGYLLTDRGYTEECLTWSGLSLNDERLDDWLVTVSKRFGVGCFEDGELYLRTQTDELSAAFMNLLQAMMVIHSLPYLV